MWLRLFTPHINFLTCCGAASANCLKPLISRGLGERLRLMVNIHWHQICRGRLLEPHLYPSCSWTWTTVCSFGWRRGLKKQLRSPWTYLNKPHLPWLLADPGKARGCSTNTIVIHSFINSLGRPLVKIYFWHRHAQMVSKNYVWPQKKISNLYLKNGDLSPTEPSSKILYQKDPL